ncbi:GDSL esterase/lipase 7 isoform X4 [Phalaenopsis equestris]|uniref:GDSL esterase/lipase 7 isoform X4 n=1 Tax=Phalaenopsis equestris TaxID=78828 RepID=UPI0009E3549B|nr:GDSL esterase/lipase 7 isoform X4 [Phalaenopsis equestris]
MQKANGDAFCILLFISLSTFLRLPISECGRAQAMFIFGDSLIDNGNNNFIPTIAKANYLPYGIDYGFPTGRFCNGLTVTDYGAKLLGLPFPVPYLSLHSKTTEILKGVNYASAAAGILDETGRHYVNFASGGRISFNGQIALFAKTVTLQLPLLIPNLKIFREYTADAFADLLISNFERQLKSLYMLGVRKMLLVGIGPLGCIPSQLFQHNSTDGSCIDLVNEQVSLFNERLVPLLVKLNSTLPGSFFVYENIYDTFNDLVQNPTNYGFIEKNQACCGSGKYGGQLSCLPLQVPCSQRDGFIFWDSFHPTQAANKIVAERCYSPSATDCQPISGYMLAQL